MDNEDEIDLDQVTAAIQRAMYVMSREEAVFKAEFKDRDDFTLLSALWRCVLIACQERVMREIGVPESVREKTMEVARFLIEKRTKIIPVPSEINLPS